MRNFLVANALYWLQEFHIDGLRVDAVASMLYLDYSRKDGEWVPNPYGGRENIDAIEFLRMCNAVIRQEAPHAFTIAEESTAWGVITACPKGASVSTSVELGWMHDTSASSKRAGASQVSHRPTDVRMFVRVHEKFINSISHDEVVHGKGSVIDKMPGDFWQKARQSSLLIAYNHASRQAAHVHGSGVRAAQRVEPRRQLDWHIAGTRSARLARVHCRARQACTRRRPRSGVVIRPRSFEWIDCTDRENTVLTFMRKGRRLRDHRLELHARATRQLPHRRTHRWSLRRKALQRRSALRGVSE